MHDSHTVTLSTLNFAMVFIINLESQLIDELQTVMPDDSSIRKLISDSFQQRKHWITHQFPKISVITEKFPHLKIYDYVSNLRHNNACAPVHATFTI